MPDPIPADPVLIDLIAYVASGSMSAITYTVETTGDKDFTVPFGYLSEGHLTAQINGATETDWIIVDPSADTKVLRFGVGVTTTAGDTVTISRSTPIATPAVSFINASTLRPREFERSRNQVLFKLQELNEGNFVGLVKNTAGTAWASESIRLTQVSNPTAGAHAVNKSWFDSTLTAALSPLGGTGNGTGLPDPSLTDTGRMPRLLQDGGSVGVDLPSHQIGGLAQAEMHYDIDMTDELVAGRSGIKIRGRIISSWPNHTNFFGCDLPLTVGSSVGAPVNGAISLQGDGKTVQLPAGKFDVTAWAVLSTGDREHQSVSQRPFSASMALRGPNLALLTELRETHIGYGNSAAAGNVPGSVTLEVHHQFDTTTGTTFTFHAADLTNIEFLSFTSHISLMEGGVCIREILE